MNMLLNLESPVTAAHRAKLAYIYVRQSTAGQVRQHQESTELQYRLVDRAALFGWPKERIEVIDDDLGEVRYIERQPRRLPAADRRDWPREGRAGAEPGCLAAGGQQPRLASALGIVLAVWSADRRWRARVRPVRLS